jgi:hypothetical protein
MTDLQQAIWSITERSWKIIEAHRPDGGTLDLDHNFTLGRTWAELRQDGHTYRVIAEVQLPEDTRTTISIPHLLSVTLDGNRVVLFLCTRVVDFAARHWKEDVLFDPMLECSEGPWMQTIPQIDKRLQAYQVWLKTEDTGYIRN